jgi:subtilase family serine protease
MFDKRSTNVFSASPSRTGVPARRLRQSAREPFRSRPLLAVGLLAVTLSAGVAVAGPTVRVGAKVSSLGEQPPTNAECIAYDNEPCYGPADIRTAYGLNALIKAGYTGAGQTIVLIEAYGSPTIRDDLAQFDADYGLPDPPKLTVLAPLGPIPPFDSTQADQVNWAFETTLDVEWAHAIAPGAAIVVLESPVDETEGVQGLPEFLELEKYALDHHLGHIISQSWAATENTLFHDAAGSAGPKLIADYHSFYRRAVHEHVTVLASSGDYGSQNPKTYDSTLGAPSSFYTFPTVSFPASSPLVTGVGGTTLYLDHSSHYEHETVWNDDALQYGAGGGGISQLFLLPEYQQWSLPWDTLVQLGGYRGVPDVSYNADDYNSAILIYVGFYDPADNGYYLIGGTSEGSPQWAGIVADLNQFAGFHLGFLNPRLYAIGGFGAFKWFGHDIKKGDNSYAGVPGYRATPGWDPASGWGTPKLGEILNHWSDFCWSGGADDWRYDH